MLQVLPSYQTGIALVPDAGDADLRLIHILPRHSGSIEHRLRRALALGLGDAAAVFIESGHVSGILVVGTS